MSEVLRAVGIFCSYAVLAVFAQSAVFTRGLGVSRLVQLVGDDRTNSWWFALLLCVTQLLVAPLAFYAGRFIAPLANRAQGFGLGSGLGYLLAVLLVTEARHRLRSRAIPSAFRGLPVTLVYIGVLALAIYGFTGHSVIL